MYVVNSNYVMSYVRIQSSTDGIGGGSSKYIRTDWFIDTYPIIKFNFYLAVCVFVGMGRRDASQRVRLEMACQLS